jgi:hypothetical protein
LGDLTRGVTCSEARKYLKLRFATPDGALKRPVLRNKRKVLRGWSKWLQALSNLETGVAVFQSEACFDLKF